MTTNQRHREQAVLFVDDEPAVLLGLNRSLHNATFRRHFAGSAFQALELIDSGDIDIVVADEQMPGMSGSDFLAIVRNRQPRIIRIILTGHASLERVIAAINTGQIHRFLTKPIETQQLVEILEEYLTALRLQATKTALNSRTDTVGRWEWDILEDTCSWNESFARIMHTRMDDGNARLPSLFSSVHIEDRAELLSIIHNCRDSGQTREAEHRIVTPDGEERGVIQFMDVFRDGDRVWKLFGMLRDITDQKEKATLLAERMVMLQATLSKTVEALGRVTEIRDPYTAGHQARVAHLAKEMGRRMGLDPRCLEGLETAAKLHDIGKIYVPAEFLTKPGTLREAEMNLMKYHPEIGHQIIQDIPFSMPVANIVLQHHERLNGSGYPGGLKEEEILPEARILAVADVFEAMSSYRPYRPGLGPEAAMRELRKGKGITFDPTAVDTLEGIMEEHPDFLSNIRAMDNSG
ncbi:MAG: HD domain-containing protein [Desulfomicrobium apsheronum]|nr:HD domain-containing protein [Desulfomicrobium apsheronum]